MSRVLVTGGAGAIGGNLVRSLVDRGDDVVVLDDLSSGRRDAVGPTAALLVGSVSDETAVEHAFSFGPERVVHLAALFANQNSVDHPEADLTVNALGTLRVLRASVEHGVAKVLICSSSCVYGTGDSDDARPPALVQETPYAMTKALAESYARFYSAEHGLDTVIVRPFNVYGPGEVPGMYRNVIPNFLARAAAGEPLLITGTGRETRDFTFVDDTVNGMLLALDADTQPGDAFNLATGVETTIGDLAERINALVGSTAGIELQARRSWDAIERRRGDATRAASLLGFSPSIGLDEGLERTWRWLHDIDG